MEKKAIEFLKNIINSGKDSYPRFWKGQVYGSEDHIQTLNVAIELTKTIRLTFTLTEKDRYLYCDVFKAHGHNINGRAFTFRNELTYAETDFVLEWMRKMEKIEKDAIFQEIDQLINSNA